GRSESPVSVRKGTVATVAACCDSHHWLVGMRSFTQYSTGPSSSPESERKAEPGVQSADFPASVRVCPVVSEYADEDAAVSEHTEEASAGSELAGAGPVDSGPVEAVRATSSANSLRPVSESTPGVIWPSAPSSGAS